MSYLKTRRNDSVPAVPVDSVEIAEIDETQREAGLLPSRWIDAWAKKKIIKNVEPNHEPEQNR